MVWKQKQKKITECSVSETEKQEETEHSSLGFDIMKAETSFKKMGQETTQKPTQTITQPTATIEERKNLEKDKQSGPALHGKEKPITLKNRFQLLGIQWRSGDIEGFQV